jgi:hypothetical protein
LRPEFIAGEATPLAHSNVIKDKLGREMVINYFMLEIYFLFS